MKAIALVQAPHDPAAAGALLGYLLGEGWSVHGYTSQDEVPDDVAAEAGFVVTALARVDGSLIGRCPKLRLLSPHLAGVTAESLLRILTAAAANCNRVARGEEPIDIETPRGESDRSVVTSAASSGGPAAAASPGRTEETNAADR